MKKKIDRGTLTGKIEKITSLKIRAIQISSQSTNASLLRTSSKTKEIEIPISKSIINPFGIVGGFLTNERRIYLLNKMQIDALLQ